MHAVTAIHPIVAPRKFEVTCSSCNLRELCLPAGLNQEDLERIENVVYARRRVKRGDSIFKAGGDFNAVYAIRSGFFKTSLLDREGREQVTGFFMGGELLGMDGIGGSYHGTGSYGNTGPSHHSNHDCRPGKAR